MVARCLREDLELSREDIQLLSSRPGITQAVTSGTGNIANPLESSRSGTQDTRLTARNAIETDIRSRETGTRSFCFFHFL
jgi:hypothetical protein